MSAATHHALVAEAIGIATANTDTSPEKEAALRALVQEFPGNACKAQEQRVEKALRQWPCVSTFELSRFADCYYAPARVMALRRQGLNIVTVMRALPTESGRPHRLGVYVLARGVQP